MVLYVKKVAPDRGRGTECFGVVKDGDECYASPEADGGVHDVAANIPECKKKG